MKIDIMNMDDPASGWSVPASKLARNTFNPIRNILETMDLQPNPSKKMISLSIGDPTVFGNLKPDDVVVEAVKDSLDSGRYNGYASSVGYPEAREAVAEHVSVTGAEVTAEDVVLCSGCSCSLDLCISVLANPGDNILIPRPGFSLYQTLAVGLGIEVKEYNLVPEMGWECDLDHMESVIDENTRAIVVNNPSNPCGSVFSEEHLRAILEIAERYRLPIIADEIYDYFTFKGRRFVPIASLTTTVPVLCCGGLTKRFLVPGWRLGWITIHDRHDILGQEVRGGLKALSQRIIGANTLVQGALPVILKETPQSFFEETISLVQENAILAYRRLKAIPGLKPVMPHGAMYMMVQVDRDYLPSFRNDLDIVEALVKEESVFCLPGQCFNIADFFRIVLTIPGQYMVEACDRIEEFCLRHALETLAERMVLRKFSFSFDAEELDQDSDSSSGDSGNDLDKKPVVAAKKKFIPTMDIARPMQQTRKDMALMARKKKPLIKRETVTRLV